MKIIDVGAWQPQARFQGFGGLSGGDHFLIRFLMEIIDLRAQQPQARFQGFGGLSGWRGRLMKVPCDSPIRSSLEKEDVTT